ncbi:hypothetical protein NIIDNTM18_15080 [Mycolicibacterium litorale]|uniref:Uncharacterized protein n=1 Tax=Mycolicibacterium litorale TaxID=758802 RepID=A0A6S6P6D3_9MYCO|nr:hypothetical protein NIIDNTM18_15080 [Mycolicibacterium litorale]
MTNYRASVDFHFDVMCPFAYQTSRWVRSVRDETGLQVNWRFFSLEEINRQEGKKHPWEWEWSYGWVDEAHRRVAGPAVDGRRRRLVRVAWTEFRHLYELQRPKSSADQQAIATTFRPYLEARDWVSINRGKVVSFDELS